MTSTFAGVALAVLSVIAPLETATLKPSTTVEAGAQYTGKPGEVFERFHPFGAITQKEAIGRAAFTGTFEYEWNAGPSVSFGATYDLSRVVSGLVGIKNSFEIHHGPFHPTQLMPQAGLTAKFGKFGVSGRLRTHLKPGKNPSYSASAVASCAVTSRMGFTAMGFFPFARDQLQNKYVPTGQARLTYRI